jgi:hypothetical protein
LEPLRADQEVLGGLVHKAMFERLILADYAVVDLTAASPNVFYELGVRHAVRPYSTVLVSADVKQIPFDLAPDRVLPYALDAGGRPSAAEEGRGALVAALLAARSKATDSPVFQLIDDLPQPDIERLKTDVFREQAEYSADAKDRIAKAREVGASALRKVEKGLGSLEDVEAGVLVDLLLSYRAVSSWEDMVRLVEVMPEPLRRVVLVRQQYGFALNRAKRRAEAEAVLLELVEEQRPSSETLGLLGRVYKDRWTEEREAAPLRAEGYLEKAIDTYRRGFEADWRDAYPGVNAVTLMEIRDPGGSEQQTLVPVVRFANRRRIDGGGADYWDHATRLELGVIARDREDATAGARSALAAMRETWEPKTTANNLALIRHSRAERGEQVEWADALENELLHSAGE